MNTHDTTQQKLPRAVTVYGASSAAIDKRILDESYRLGAVLVTEGYSVVCGGGKAGVMAAVIEGATAAGGNAIGVLPSFMIAQDWAHPAATNIIEVPDMHTRKRTMASMSCAAIAMPGGCGTFEELLEIITWRQLGLYNGHVIIFNYDNYYAPLLEMFEKAIRMKFMNPDHRALWHVVSTVEEAIEVLRSEPQYRPFSQKIH